MNTNNRKGFFTGFLFHSQQMENVDNREKKAYVVTWMVVCYQHDPPLSNQLILNWKYSHYNWKFKQWRINYPFGNPVYWTSVEETKKLGLQQSIVNI